MKLSMVYKIVRFGRIFILDQLFLSDSLPNNFVKIWLVLEPNFENPIVREFWKLSQVFAARSNYICKFWHSVPLPDWYWVSQSGMQSKKPFLLLLFCRYSEELILNMTSRTQTEWLIDFFACYTAVYSLQSAVCKFGLF